MNSLDVIFEALQWFETPTTCLTIKMSTSFMGRDMRFQIGCWSKWFIYVYDCRSLTHKCLMRYLVWDRLLLKMIFHKTYIYDLFWLPYGILRYVFSGNFLFGIIYHHRIHNFFSLWTLLICIFRRNFVSNFSLQMPQTNDALSSAILKFKLLYIMLLFFWESWKNLKKYHMRAENILLISRLALPIIELSKQ